MNNILIDTFLKNLGINICLNYFNFKLIGFKITKLKQKVLIFIFSIFISCVFTVLRKYFSNITLTIANYLLFSIILWKIALPKFNIALLTTIISNSLSYITLSISSLSILFVLRLLNLYNIDDSPLIFIAIITLQFVIVHFILKFKRFKYGLAFLKNIKFNDIFNVILIICSLFVIVYYFLIGNYKNISRDNIFICFICFMGIFALLIINSLIFYQKQKLQTQALKDYETQLSETQQKLQTALAEKQTLIKSNHEFHHRQKALNKKLDDLAKQYSENYNTEFAEELGNISKRLDKLSDEYVEKTHFSPALVKSNIEEIDDMLSYMKSECEKNNIDFSLKIDCDINYIINNFISKSQLETLLGDLISNSIIAISHSSNNYKNIMVIFGIKDSTYELCILDSGIPFEIDTLLNLGLSPASTHLDEGGTGIGFITTFETINHCNASITINENTNNNYTKSIEIQFDNKNEYRIITNRKDDLIKRNINNRKIIIMD